jgi:hypothetical protein
VTAEVMPRASRPIANPTPPRPIDELDDGFAAPLPPRASGSLALIDELLRDRDAILRRVAAGVDLATTMRVMLATIVVAMAAVGAALGTFHGDRQIAYAAIKLPLVLIGTAALSAPALTAIGAALGRESRLAVDLAIVTTALAFGALMLSACTPVILFARAVDLGYHRMILVVVVLFAAAGLGSLRIVARALALQARRGWQAPLAVLCLVFALVGGQLAWALRPYLVRPRAEQAVFVQYREGSLFDAVVRVVESAQGIYTRDRAPLPERP